MPIMNDVEAFDLISFGIGDSLFGCISTSATHRMKAGLLFRQTAGTVGIILLPTPFQSVTLCLVGLSQPEYGWV